MMADVIANKWNGTATRTLTTTKKWMTVTKMTTSTTMTTAANVPRGYGNGNTPCRQVTTTTKMTTKSIHDVDETTLENVPVDDHDVGNGMPENKAKTTTMITTTMTIVMTRNEEKEVKCCAGNRFVWRGLEWKASSTVIRNGGT